MNARSWLLSLLIVAPSYGEDKLRLVRETEALTPEQERAALHVPAGFEVQLFASEPMINKPINMAFDARGRLWVSSTVEYPYNADKSRWSDPQGTRVKDSRDAIKVLEDTDGDGKADKVTDFADGLNIPTGVVPWHKPEHKAGCIAWSIPNIWYFADSDGDDKADVREVIFGPLGYEKDTHGMCSSFRLGLDGWVYATHGFNNTSHFKAKDGSTLELHSGNVFRFRPDGSRVEPWTHGQVNPFGLCWDRYGNLFSADCHSSPIYQLIRGAHYPSFGKPHDGLGFAPVMCQHTHGSTGICGIVYIDGGVWGPEWDDHTFVGNVVTSKVNHDHITFTGSTPKANEKPDFLTSDDPWFRPVDLQLGPDNALYIADFYNKIIGHYEVPLEHPGRDKERGRIWRVVKRKDDLKLTSADMEKMTHGTLAHELHSSNLTRRSLASQTIIRRGSLEPEADATASPESVAHRLWIAANLGQVGDRELRQAMRFDAFTSTHAMRVQAAFRDSPGIPSYRALTSMITDGGSASQIISVQTLPPTRLPANNLLVLSKRRELNELEKVRIEAQAVSGDSGFASELASLFLRPQDVDDPVTLLTAKIALREILASSGFKGLPPDMIDLVEVVLSVPTDEASQWLWVSLQMHPQRSDLLRPVLSHIARYAEPNLMIKALAKAREVQPEGLASSVTLLTAINDGLSERGAPANPELLAWAQELAVQLLASLDQKAVPAWTSIASAESAPKWSLQSRQCSDGKAAKVLQSMIKGGYEEKLTGTLRSKDFTAPAKLSLWINGHRGFPTAKAHDKNLVRIVDAKEGTVLASAFPPRNDVCQRVELDLAKHVGKTVRLEIVDGDDGKAYAWLGITRIEPAVVSVNDFQTEDSTRSSLKTLAAMLQHTAPAALREKLAAFMPPRPAPPPLPISPEQRKQLDALITSRVAVFAKKKPDLEVGSNVFRMNCAVCHQIKGEGGLIGPQLDGIGARGPERLCEDILDPNRNVDAHFHIHTLTLKNGSATSGFLKGEAGQVIILADAAGQEHRVRKDEVVKDKASPMSLMPPSFGQTISEQDFSDLLGWLLTK